MSFYDVAAKRPADRPQWRSANLKTVNFTDLPALAAQIDTEHRLCESSLREGLAHAIHAGSLLAQARRQLPHGGWSEWLRNNFAGSERTAQLYMRVAANVPQLEQNRNTVADLNMTLRQAARTIAKPKAGKREPLYRFIPPAGHFTYLGVCAGGWGVVMPSEHPGYYFLGLVERDVTGALSSTAGNLRALRPEGIDLMMPDWAHSAEMEFVAGGHGGLTADKANPWQYNQLLYFSEEEYLQSRLAVSA